jgi:hypothetical protein
MDLQIMLNNAIAAKRAEELKTSSQLTLGEIILKLENCSLKDNDGDNKEVRFGFGYFRPTTIDSWRGSYCELAIGYDEKAEEKTAEQFLKELKEAVGKTYVGYKGGDFLMGKNTPVWVSNYSQCPNVAVVDIVDKGYWILIKTEYMDY